MHVRADTASLHAACTSVGGEPDPLLLQTDGGFWPSRKNTKGVTPALQLQYKEPGILTHDVKEASLWKNTRWGVLKKQSEDHYAIFDGFGYEDESDLVTLHFFFLVSPNNTNTPVTLSKEKPEDIQKWKREQLLTKDYDNVRWFVHPRTFFTEMNKKNRPTVLDRARAMHVTKGMSEKEIQVAVATTMPATAASLNPYVVQRCRADRALDPDASWQTDGGPWFQWPKYFRRTRQIAPEPSVSQSKKFKATMIRRTDRLNFVSAEYEVLVEHAHTADARFNYIKNHYWTSPSFDTAVACQGNWNGALVYTCYYQRGLKLFLCYCVGHPSEHKGKFVWIKKGLAQDIITGKFFQDILQVPKDNFNVCWFTNNESLLRTNSFNQKKRGV